jgi:hypothetical protein
MSLNKNKTFIIITSSIAFVFIGILWYLSSNIKIKEIQLTSPNNYAFQELVDIKLNKPANVYINYWKKGSSTKFITTETAKNTHHSINLLLLKTNTTYEYQVIIDKLIDSKSKVYSFHTREQSPWLRFSWVKTELPHSSQAFGDGLIMLCYARTPGYIAMVNSKGDICWYWQVDDIGVRAATITPQGTILAMLRPPKKDVIDDKPKEHRKILEEIQKPMRRGKIGFAGGTALAEIDLTGKTLWRLDLDKKDDYKIIHHDIRMDKNRHIHTLFRSMLPYDMTDITGKGLDTLGGDGILVMDTTGKELWKWSAWDSWDIKNDPFIDRFTYDRFHMNALNFDTDSNYLVSVAIEDQIWKINSKTGKLMWKFGRNGDFKMDTTSYFSFQHAVNINSEGDIMLFDNNLYLERSRALSFTLDTTKMIATTRINAPLPTSKYTSRMGNAYLLQNGNLLQTSSKTGSVLITDRKGEILWELDSPYVPYRAEYVPTEIWKEYFIRD